jgi:hypothetical protein
VHETNGGRRSRDDLERLPRFEGSDVVDHARTRFERFAHELGLARVDRDGLPGPRQRLDHRQCSAALFIERDRLRTRPRRFAADVEDIGAFSDERAPMRYRGVRAGVKAAIGERIGSHVDDTHQQWTRQRERKGTAVQFHYRVNG